MLESILSVFALVVSFYSLSIAQGTSRIYWISALFVVFILTINGVIVGHVSYLYFILFVSVFIFLSCIAEIIGGKIFNFYSSIVVEKVFSNKSSKSHTVLYVLLTIFMAFALYTFSIGGAKSFYLSWVDIYSGSTTLQKICYNISIFLYLSSIYFFFLAVKMRYSKVVLLALAVLIVLFPVLIKIKSFILPFVVSLYFISSYDVDRGEFKLFNTDIIKSIALFFILYFSVMIFRWMGNLNDYSLQKLIDVANSVATAGFERNLFDQSLFVFSYFSNYHETLNGQTYLRFIMYPLNILFGIQSPENTVYVYYDLMHYNRDVSLMKGSVHPSLFSDAFANFHIFGVFVGFIFVCLLKCLDFIICRFTSNIVLFIWVLLCFGFPLILRGSVYYGILYILMYISLFIITFSVILLSQNILKGSFKN